ncbi:MAG: ABC transporter permease [Bacteroidetes bacterium]|nr:ABC transporter permease [Bacteroidota bacterium]
MKKRKFTSENVRLGAYLHDVWENRVMIMVFAKRDIKTKYAQTMFGLFWVVLQPLTGATIFTLFFTNLFDLADFGITIPYFLFSLSGYLGWMYFIYIVTNAGISLQQEENLIKKVNFPKLILPLAKAVVGFVDFGIGILLTIFIAIAGGYLSFTHFLLILPATALITMIGLSVAIWLSALTIRYRDFHHFIPYVINFGIWITPVFYPATIIPEEYGFVLYLNPMAGAIEMIRWALFETQAPSSWYLLSYLVALLLIVGGIHYFTRIENLIADHL